MKRLLPLFGAALFMVACNQTPEQVAGTSTSPYIQQQAQQQQSVADTAGLASYNAWKAQNELADLNEYQAKQTVAAPVRKAATAKAPVRKAAASRPATQSSPAETTASTGSGSGNTAGAGNESAETAPAEKKEGWSKAAKGAVIGGVAGAAGGAVINKKNRVVGAVVGAVIGAGGGYVIGRQQDKKDGRIQIQ